MKVMSSFQFFSLYVNMLVLIMLQQAEVAPWKSRLTEFEVYNWLLAIVSSARPFEQHDTRTFRSTIITSANYRNVPLARQYRNCIPSGFGHGLCAAWRPVFFFGQWRGRTWGLKEDDNASACCG